MNPRVIAVKPNPDYTLTITFANGEVRRFNVLPYLETGIFRALKDVREFNTVKPFLGSVQWRGGQDFCPDTLYEESILLADAVPFSQEEETSDPSAVQPPPADAASRRG
jgi:hypothetical protein